MPGTKHSMTDSYLLMKRSIGQAYNRVKVDSKRILGDQIKQHPHLMNNTWVF